MNRGITIIAVGVLILLVGVAMPSSTTQTETVCTDPAPAGGCYASGHHEIEVDKKNDFKAPTLVSGIAVGLVGAVLISKD